MESEPGESPEKAEPLSKARMVGHGLSYKASTPRGADKNVSVHVEGDNNQKSETNSNLPLEKSIRALEIRRKRNWGKLGLFKGLLKARLRI